MYADKITPSMEQALDETNRRREKQLAYNPSTASTPQPLRKKIADITDLLEREDADTQELIGSGRMQSRGKSGAGRGAMAADVGVSAGVRGRASGRPGRRRPRRAHPGADRPRCTRPPAELHFELAARLRDEIGELKKELRQMSAATALSRLTSVVTVRGPSPVGPI